MRPFLLVLLLPALALADRDAKLVGRWGLDGSTEFTFELRADGTGEFDDAQVKWSTDAGTLRLDFGGEQDAMRYRIAGDVVTLEQEGEKQQWKKLGAPAKKGALERVKEKAANKAALDGAGVPDADQDEIRRVVEGRGKEPARPKEDARQTPQDRQLAQLLLANAWCSFSYKSGGTYTGGGWSSTGRKRVVFRADGSVEQGSSSESDNSGGNGAYAGQGGNVVRAFWKVQGGQLQLSEDGRTWAPQALQITANSNGAPIVKSDGEEFMRCQ